MQVKVTDNSQLFIDAKNAAVARALEAIGLTAEGYAADNCPVDTGRLWNSITHATKEFNGKGGDDSTAMATPEDNAVYIGTNVEYAKYVETDGTKKHNVGRAHFLRDAAANHGDEYKRIAEEYLKNA